MPAISRNSTSRPDGAPRSRALQSVLGIWKAAHPVLLVALIFWSSVAVAEEFHDDIERDFVLRTLGQLQITNLRGGITVQGWALDKIRVKARRRATAPTREEAAKLFRALDFRYRAFGNVIELSAEYGRGLEIQERLREREQPHTSMEMIVYAPANLDVTVWANEGTVTVRNWSAAVDVRTSRGDVRIEGLKSKSAAVLCSSCNISAKAIRGGTLRCMGGSGSIDITDFSGEQLFVETTSGAQNVSKISAEQLYVSRAGRIQGRDLRGRIEFQNQRGDVSLQDGWGFVSGRTESGDIAVTMRRWEFADKALVESVKGSVSLSLPVDFTGELDIWSVAGKTSSAFVAQAFEDRAVVYGPEPANHIRGRVGDGGEQLKLFSHEGDVRLLKIRDP